MSARQSLRCDDCGHRFTLDITPEEADSMRRREIQCEQCWRAADDREADASLTRLPLWAHPDGH